MNHQNIYSLGIIGVRGYVGKELLCLLVRHPQIKVEWLSSRQLAGQSINNILDDGESLNYDCTITTLNPQQVAEKGSDIIILALPNGLAAPYVRALEKKYQEERSAGWQSKQIIIDLSADYRFDDQWIYSVPELDGTTLDSASSKTPSTLIKISNPGCYATAMQLAIAPLVDLLAAPANCFGVSGYSGAGTKPSDYNDIDFLSNNLVGYKLVEHLHEREVSSRFNKPVIFSPHVAEFFRGINMTVQLTFEDPQKIDSLNSRYKAFYQEFPLVEFQQDVPTVKQVVNTPTCLIGGLTLSADGKRATIICCLDNLLKGAASQALQNINIALGLTPLLAVSNNHSSISGEVS